MWNLIAIDIVCLVCDGCCWGSKGRGEFCCESVHSMWIARDSIWLALTHQNAMKFYINKVKYKECVSKEEEQHRKNRNPMNLNSDGMCKCVCMFLIKTSPNRLNFTQSWTVAQEE